MDAWVCRCREHSQAAAEEERQRALKRLEEFERRKQAEFEAERVRAEQRAAIQRQRELQQVCTRIPMSLADWRVC